VFAKEVTIKMQIKIFPLSSAARPFSKINRKTLNSARLAEKGAPFSSPEKEFAFISHNKQDSIHHMHAERYFYWLFIELDRAPQPF
jgi:hypothetical protein